MPASDIKLLFQFEDYVEPAISAALTAAQSGARVYTSQSTETIVTPCLSVALRIGAVNSHRYAPPTLDYYVPDQWRCSISGIVRTKRGENADDHKTYRALLRYVMANIFALVNTGLDYHAFDDVPLEQGTSMGLDEENNHDVSEISFAGLLAIKPAAWPAVTP